MKPNPGPERHPSLQRYISQAGHCSRRKAAQLIEEGKVELDGQVCTVPWQPVEPRQRVKVEGVGIRKEKKRLLYLALHKPSGYLTTNSDPQGRSSTHDLIQGVYKERLFHVGRLDKNSSGLIFFTNDGDFAQAVQHPSAVIEKEYEVKTRKNIPEFMLQHWMRGIRIAGVRYQLSRYRMLGPHRVRLVLTEGLNREIRRVFEHFHIPLKQVHRLRIGTVRLYGLAPGEFRHLKPFEWKVLKSGKNANRMGEWPSQETAEPREARHLRSSRRQGRETASPQPPGLYNTPSRPYRNEPSAHLRRERKKRNRTEIGRTSPYPKRTGSDSRKKTSEGTRYVRKSNYRR